MDRSKIDHTLCITNCSSFIKRKYNMVPPEAVWADFTESDPTTKLAGDDESFCKPRLFPIQTKYGVKMKTENFNAIRTMRGNIPFQEIRVEIQNPRKFTWL